MKHLFVPYELALVVKEREFDEPCLAMYTEEGKRLTYTSVPLNNTNSFWKSSPSEVIPAPTFQQVQDWLREKHNIEIYCPNYYKNSKGYKPQYECRINDNQLGTGLIAGSSEGVLLFSNYYEALTKAIEEALKLI